MYIKVHVYPGMRNERVKKLADNSYEFVLREPAERNLANSRTKELVAEIANWPITKVKQVTGFRSPSKLFELID